MSIYLLIDGYNIINSWPEFSDDLEKNLLEDARDKLIMMLQEYQASKEINIILVFDAYRSFKMLSTISRETNIEVVYTKKGVSADLYIEKWVNENAKDNEVWVASSDWLQQTIIFSRGGIRISSRELRQDVLSFAKDRKKEYLQKEVPQISTLADGLDVEALRKLNNLRKSKDKETL